MTINRRLFGAFFLCLLFSAGAAAPVLARDFKVDPGEVPQLREGEGLLIVAIDSDMDVRSLKIRGEDRMFSGGSLTGIGEGSTMGLYVLPAGRYRWDRMNLGWLRWRLSTDPEARFEVKAGEITYAGDLVYRNLVRMHYLNRGLRAIDWLEREHPQLARRYPFRYDGLYPDPFPGYYREQLAEHPRHGEDRTLPAPAPGELPLPVRELWRDSRLHSVTMSPNGRYVASSIRAGLNDWSIDVSDLDQETVATLAESAGEITELLWVADDILTAEVQTENGDRLMIFRFGADGRPTTFMMPRFGIIVDSLRGDEDNIVFASESSGDRLVLHRLNLRDFDRLKAYRFNPRDRINVGLEDDRLWFLDGQGQVRAAVVVREETDEEGEDERVRYLVYGSAATGYQTVMKLEGDEDAFSPVAMSADGRLIYGISGEDRAQQELVEFDPVAKKVTRTLFSKPGIDVVWGLFDARRQPIGASYYEGGQLVSEYFDDASRGLSASLGKAFGDRTVAVINRDRESRRLLLVVDGSDQPAQYYVLDRDAGRASLVEETAPWLNERTFAPSHVIRTKARDGLEIEAFLTLPAGDGERPLIVMAHGGPIGIADRRHFDPEVQFLASLGYAVLQVNFRGSSGYGRAFREAGTGSAGYGSGIEDDIDAALTAALAEFPLDEKRMCAVGASYGGYSGLWSAIRWPDRYRCVVSMFGVSDRILFFTASDGGRAGEDVRKLIESRIGNPRTDQAQMIETSPLFQYERLKVPVMLVHGQEDIRVDYEHTRRLVRMLNLVGRPPVLLEFRDEAHGLRELDNIERNWHGIAGFLRQNLGD